ncbi:hypothetical protein FGO68_gene2791 [Halteria grandinella]|uniref:AP2/ERF domain-containing protein n=1 Tax=Halteria grandinella TaxID=5974 RepID=A0A8J8T699_HALGN|nr:hypothetical protein FGO68_gene2791 [Halteria grandinella]
MRQDFQQTTSSFNGYIHAGSYQLHSQNYPTAPNSMRNAGLLAHNQDSNFFLGRQEQLQSMRNLTLPQPQQVSAMAETMIHSNFTKLPEFRKPIDEKETYQQKHHFRFIQLPSLSSTLSSTDILSNCSPSASEIKGRTDYSHGVLNNREEEDDICICNTQTQTQVQRMPTNLISPSSNKIEVVQLPKLRETQIITALQKSLQDKGFLFEKMSFIQNMMIENSQLRLQNGGDQPLRRTVPLNQRPKRWQVQQFEHIAKLRLRQSEITACFSPFDQQCSGFNNVFMSYEILPSGECCDSDLKISSSIHTNSFDAKTRALSKKTNRIDVQGNNSDPQIPTLLKTKRTTQDSQVSEELLFVEVNPNKRRAVNADLNSIGQITQFLSSQTNVGSVSNRNFSENKSNRSSAVPVTIAGKIVDHQLALVEDTDEDLISQDKMGSVCCSSAQQDLYPLPHQDVEDLFSALVQRRRLRLYALMQGKNDTEIIITPTPKVTKGETVFFANSIEKIFNRSDVKDFRGSKYRGISKNGSSWQILVMLSRQKRYVGKLPTEEAAARFYDKVSIQYQGDLAKTNFPYTKRQVMRLLKAKPLLE